MARGCGISTAECPPTTDCAFHEPPTKLLSLHRRHSQGDALRARTEVHGRAYQCQRSNTSSEQKPGPIASIRPGLPLGGFLAMVSRSTCSTEADERLPISPSERQVSSSASGGRSRAAVIASMTLGPPGWLTQAPMSVVLRPWAPRNLVTSSAMYCSHHSRDVLRQHQLEPGGADVVTHRAQRVGVEVAARIDDVRPAGADLVRRAARRQPPPRPLRQQTARCRPGPPAKACIPDR